MKNLIHEMNQFLQIEGDLFDRSPKDPDYEMELIYHEADRTGELSSLLEVDTDSQ